MSAALALSTLGRLPSWWERLRSVDNPVLVRELRARMRGARAFGLMSLYVGLLALAAYGFLVSRLPRPSASMMMAIQAYQQLGPELFLAVTGLQLTLVLLLTPGLTCGLFTREWEQRTLHLLALTTISSRSIVLGKLLAALCYLALLLLCSLPILALTFLLGGVSPLQIGIALLLNVGVILFLGTVGLLASLLTRRTYVATLLAYGAAFFLTCLLPLSTSSPLLLVMSGGLTVSALFMVLARWVLPRLRPGWRPARATYLAIWGLSYCAVAELINIRGVEEAISNFLRYQSIAYWISMPTSLTYLFGSTAALKSLVILASLALFISVGALLAAIALFRVLRAPEPDDLETEAYLRQEAQLARRESPL